MYGFTTESKVDVQSTLVTPRFNHFTSALPFRGSRDPLRLVEGGALPYKGARHCPGFSLGRVREQARLVRGLALELRVDDAGFIVYGSGLRVWG